MKKYYILITITLALLFFSACGDEEKLTPSDIDSMSRFEFPEGDSEADQIFSDIYDKFGVQVIYKNWVEKDWTKSWTNPGVVENIGYIGRHYENGEVDSLNLAARFVRDNYFAYLSEDIVKKTHPPYLYLVNAYAGKTVMGAYTYIAYAVTSVPGLDFTVLSLSGSPTASSSTANIIFQDNFLSTELFNQDEEVIHRLRKKVLWYGFFNEAMNPMGKSKLPTMVEPSNFATNIDVTTAIKTAENEKENENYYLKRGFVDVVGPTFTATTTLPKLSDYNSPSKVKNLFQHYIRLAMHYDKETIEEKYGKYPLVMERYNWTVDYMKETYDIDLQAIAKK